MIFNKESDFEMALIKILSEKGWEKEVLKNYSEQDLLQNWANILFENNRDIDRLNDYPLTDGEMQQILEEIEKLRTPLKLNGFINGKSVSIVRDNPDDKLHFGKEVSLKIYDRREIAAGQSRYQIVQQPKFPTKSKILNDRRGDLMLLINGMPVIHIELKKSGIPVSEAYHQIEKYSQEGIFSGLFSLVQIFVAMEPNETVYFANPGPDGKFNPDYYFHWADYNNEPINEWDKVASTLLSIPMAHQLIGFYTVADDSDGVLKVMRSYQYFAASAISDKVSKTKWEGNNQLGGYVWHTTGSGKTMTSFKSAQLIASSKDADKVIFLMDRIELGTQSLKEYRGFADENESVQSTENTGVLITKLKSTDPADTLIVTSIQKMSNIKDEAGGLKASDIEYINRKRIVFIVDEAHRSTFGDMLITIKTTFPRAIFFGFTGTPIQDENQKKKNTTTTVFGSELHRYSIADGIRDKNVLGFDPYKVLTFKDRDVRKVVALEKAKAQSEEEAIQNFEKLPSDATVCRKFAKDFNEFNGYLEAAKIQGFKWGITTYDNAETGETIEIPFDEKTYLVLVLRYKELSGGGGGTGEDDVPYDLVGYITEIDTGLIDAEYMNSRFEKYLKLLSLEGATQEAVEQAETELHKTFATLSQEEQKYANIFLHDIQRGDVVVAEGKTLRDYITEYLSKAKDDQIHRLAVSLGIDEEKLRNIMSLKLNSTNINEFGRYDELKKTVDKAKAKEYFEKIEETKIIPPKVNIKVDNLLREFILSGGFDIKMPETKE